VLLAFLKGLILGVVAGVPLGPASAAIFDAAARRSVDRAMAVGLGAAIVDAVYALVVSAGLGAAFSERPVLRQAFLGAGGLFLVAFGAVTVRARAPDPACPAAGPQRPVRSLLAGLGAGVLIAVLNPGLLASWVVMAGTVLAGLDPAAHLAAAAGVFAGTFGWFAVVAFLGWTGRVRLGSRVVWVTRGAGVLLIAYGVFLVGRLGLSLTDG